MSLTRFKKIETRFNQIKNTIAVWIDSGSTCELIDVGGECGHVCFVFCVCCDLWYDIMCGVEMGKPDLWSVIGQTFSS